MPAEEVQMCLYSYSLRNHHFAITDIVSEFPIFKFSVFHQLLKQQSTLLPDREVMIALLILALGPAHLLALAAAPALRNPTTKH